MDNLPLSQIPDWRLAEMSEEADDELAQVMRSCRYRIPIFGRRLDRAMALDAERIDRANFPMRIAQVRELLDLIFEEDRLHPIGCATWEQAALVAVDDAKNLIDKLYRLQP